MDTSPNTEQRLTNLEIKASFNEDLLDKLDQVIVRQQQQIDLLIQEVARLRQPAPNSGTGVPRDARDDMPPHY
jgi:SlyX protein